MRENSSERKLDALLENAEFDEEKGEIRIGDADWILMEANVLRDLIKGISRVLGTGAIPILFEAGRYAGRNFAAELLEKGVRPKEVPALLKTFFICSGWGKIQIQGDFDEKTAEIIINNCVTVRWTKSKEAGCHLIRGYIAGVSDVVFSAITDCTETKCSASGNPFCEFKVHCLFKATKQSQEL